jgi:hypothetical protein
MQKQWHQHSNPIAKKNTRRANNIHQLQETTKKTNQIRILISQNCGWLKGKTKSVPLEKEKYPGFY